MRKIKQCICDSTKKLSDGVFPIGLSYFLKTMALILLMDADQRLMMNYPTVSYSGEDFDGEAVKNPKLINYVAVLNDIDLARSISQFTQLQGFLSWFLEQNEPIDDEELTTWFDNDYLIGKWNEYAAQHNE